MFILLSLRGTKQSYNNKTKGSLTLFGMTLRVRLLRPLRSLAMTEK